jgi:hypothetical protein
VVAIIRQSPGSPSTYSSSRWTQFTRPACLQRGVRAQHLFQQPGVGALEGRDVAVEQRTRPLVGRFEQFLGHRRQFVQPAAGALQARHERQPQRLARDHRRGRIVGDRGDPVVRQGSSHETSPGAA